MNQGIGCVFPSIRIKITATKLQAGYENPSIVRYFFDAQRQLFHEFIEISDALRWSGLT